MKKRLKQTKKVIAKYGYASWKKRHEPIRVSRMSALTAWNQALS